MLSFRNTVAGLQVALLFRALSDASIMSPAALRFMPQSLRLSLRIDPMLSPSIFFRADIMERSVTKEAKPHRPFVIVLLTSARGHASSEVMHLARHSPAYETGQGGDDVVTSLCARKPAAPPIAELRRRRSCATLEARAAYRHLVDILTFVR
jgi:hypothetical protein